MLKEISFSVIYLALCVMGEKTLGEPDEKILKTLGPTLIIVIAFCVLVTFMDIYCLIDICLTLHSCSTAT